MSFDNETIRTVINGGYLTMAIFALAVAIATFPTIWHRMKRSEGLGKRGD